MMTDQEEKRPRGRPRLPESRKLPPPITIRLTNAQMESVDALYDRDPTRTKAQIVRDALEAGLAALSET